MKKVLTWCSASLMALSLVACGGLWWPVVAKTVARRPNPMVGITAATPLSSPSCRSPRPIVTSQSALNSN
ncbi:hypothetical protein D3C85_1665800 [compost metagenome]